MKQLHRLTIYLVISMAIFAVVKSFGHGEGSTTGISMFVYVFGVCSVLSILILQPLARMNTYLVVAGNVGIYLLIHFFLFDKTSLSSDTRAYIPFAEITFLFVIILLALRLSQSFHQVKGSIESMTLPDSVKTLGVAMGDVKTEMARSRRHNRSLGIVIVRFGNDMSMLAFSHIKDEISLELVDNEKTNALARTLAKTARRTDQVILQREKQRFILLCPETNKQGLDGVLERITVIAENRLGTSLECGAATFPNDAVTFEELLAKANPPPELSAVSETAPVPIKGEM